MHTGSTVRLSKGDRAQDDPCAHLSSHRARVGGEEKAEADCLEGAYGTSTKPEVHQTGWIHRWHEWRKWKLDHRVSSATYNMLLYLPGNQYFSKRLTNEGKLRRASEFQEKFPNVLSFFCNFLRVKSNLRPRTGHIRLRAQDSVSLSLLREWSHNEEVVPSFGLMDLRQAPITADREPNSWDLVFFSYIHCMRRMSKPTFIDPRIWLWVHSSEEHAKMSAEFVK